MWDRTAKEVQIMGQQNNSERHRVRDTDKSQKHFTIHVGVFKTYPLVPKSSKKPAYPPSLVHTVFLQYYMER